MDNNTRKTVKSNQVFTIKNKCPYCGANLKGSADAWEQRDDGTWKATNLDINCVTMPDADSEQWDHWVREHTNMPYIYWHPVIIRIENKINSLYNFEL